MVHVAGGDDQDRLLRLADDLRHGLAQRLQRLERAHAHRDRHEGELLADGLQEGKLHFGGVFGAMGVRVFAG